jgi:hypothetical protein
LYRSRARRFDELVLQAVAQPSHAGSPNSLVEFVVEGRPATCLPTSCCRCRSVPLARLDPAWSDAGNPARPARPARIVLYRRPLLARADGEEELGDLVLDVVIEEFAKLLGLDPQAIDPGYPDET